MSSPSLKHVRLLSLLLAFHSIGCGAEPKVTGRWTGRLVPVTVTDSVGQKYGAVGLAIECGPRLPAKYRAAWEPTEAAKVPLLARKRTLPLLIGRVKGIPIGSRVRVRGSMYMSTFLVPLESGIEGGGIGVSRVGDNGGALGGGPIILLPGRRCG